MQTYTIPRDIRVKEGIAFGLNGKQIIYLAMGLGGIVLIWSTGLSIEPALKIAGSALAVVGSLSFSLAKIHGQEMDKYMLNSAKFPLREKQFGGDQNVLQPKAPVLTIRYNIRESGAVPRSLAHGM